MFQNAIKDAQDKLGEDPEATSPTDAADGARARAGEAPPEKAAGQTPDQGQSASATAVPGQAAGQSAGQGAGKDQMIVQATEYINFGSARIPYLDESNFRSLHPALQREHAMMLYKCLGHQTIGTQVPHQPQEIVDWVVRVQAVHLEPLRGASKTLPIRDMRRTLSAPEQLDPRGASAHPPRRGQEEQEKAKKGTAEKKAKKAAEEKTGKHAEDKPKQDAEEKGKRDGKALLVPPKEERNDAAKPKVEPQAGGERIKAELQEERRQLQRAEAEREARGGRAAAAAAPPLA